MNIDFKIVDNVKSFSTVKVIFHIKENTLAGLTVIFKLLFAKTFDC